MYFDSLEDALIFIKNNDFIGLMHIFYEHEVGWLNCMTTVKEMTLQPFCKRVDLTALEIKHVALITNPSVQFKPSLPKFLLGEVLNQLLRRKELYQSL